MFKIIIIFLCVVSMCQASVFTENNQCENSASLLCSPELQNVVATIQQLPEARKLIATIQEEGPISIVVNTTSTLRQFGAFWDPDRRIIAVNVTSDSSQGTLIGSILFELQNAFVNAKLNHLHDLASEGKIEKEKYVRAIEFLEYKNSLKASKLSEKGVKLGIFPVEARLPTYRNFKEHYRFQKLGGHSAWLEQNYNQIAPKS
jgi:hypothetical protein